MTTLAAGVALNLSNERRDRVPTPPGRLLFRSAFRATWSRCAALPQRTNRRSSSWLGGLLRGEQSSDQRAKQLTVPSGQTERRARLGSATARQREEEAAVLRSPQAAEGALPNAIVSGTASARLQSHVSNRRCANSWRGCNGIPRKRRTSRTRDQAERLRNSSNSGTVNAVSPCAGL